ncbi:MAG: hypothetical protein ABL890_02495 [Candidatus Peribacteraceae bacterium]
MLRRKSFARLAFHHSPEKEQRLIAVQGGNAPQGPQNPPDQNAQRNQSGTPLSKRQEFHDAMFDAVSPDSSQRVVNDYLPEILEVTGGTESDVIGSDANEIVELVRGALVDRLILEEGRRKELATLIENIDTSVAEETKLQALIDGNKELFAHYVDLETTVDPSTIINLVQAILHKEVLQIQKIKFAREKSAKWNFLMSDDFEELYWKGKKPVNGETPSAFVLGNTVHFNIDHPDFRGEDRELLAKRAIIHEMTHIALGVAEKKNTLLQKWTDTLRGHPRWNDLRSALEEMFHSNGTMQHEQPTVRKMVDEALAIYAAEERSPRELKPDTPRNRIVLILRDIFQNPHTGHLTTLKTELDAKLDLLLETKNRDGTESPSIDSMLLRAANDSQQNKNVEDRINNDPEAEERRANAAEEMEEVDEKNAKEKITPEMLEEKVGTVRGKIKTMVTQADLLGTLAAESPHEGDDKEKMVAEVRTLRESLGNMGTDLVSIDSLTQGLKNWGKLSVEEKSQMTQRLQFPDNPYERVGANYSEAEADAATAVNRQKSVDALHGLLSKWEKMAENIEKAVTTGNDEQKASEKGQVEGSFMGWMKKTFRSNGGGIVWLSPLNIVNIVKSYRDAIVENYKSGQLVKENMTARAISEKFFFFKPIRHTLKKLSRSTNNKETSEFKEYITAEGYTFEEIFGPDGKGEKTGLLHENRHNFNRAKAVLEYAADHAWLYFLNRLDGHNVYEIDFQGVEGKQSFEELVEMHEAGKSKQIQKGTDKVDKDPDVPPIMDMMLSELKQKNIFVVQGIMKRLQDKAKYSHSNTWMLTTLLMYIRDNSQADPTLKFCLDKGMMDNISNHTIGQSAWSITWLKLKRHEIAQWKNNGERDGRIGFGNNTVTSTMEQIEKKLAELGADFPDDDEGKMAKYEAIGLVLAGKTFSESNEEVMRRGLTRYGWKKGASISIFDDEFVKYRDDYFNTTTGKTTDPGKTDDDYFAHDNGGSDILLASRTITEAIVNKESQGSFTEPAKAKGYYAQLFDRDDELQARGGPAAANFRIEMKKKLISTFKVGYQIPAAATQIRKDLDSTGRPILEELKRRKIITEADFSTDEKKLWHNLMGTKAE